MGIFFGYGQAKQKYIRLGKLTTTEISQIDVSDTNVVYTAYDVTLGLEVINIGAGWVPRMSASSSVDWTNITNIPVNLDIDGSGTIVNATSPITISGSGTIGSPYQIGIDNSLYLTQGSNILTSDFSLLHSSGNGLISDNDTRTIQLLGGVDGLDLVIFWLGSDLAGIDFESNGVGYDYTFNSSGAPTISTDVATKDYVDNAGGGGGSDDQTASEVPYTNNSQTTVEGALDDLYLNGSGSGIANVVEDTTPELGGTLDANGNEINSLTSLTGIGTVNFPFIHASVRMKLQPTNVGTDGTGTVRMNNSDNSFEVDRGSGFEKVLFEGEGGSLSTDDQNRLSNANKSPVSVELSADVNLSTLDQNVTSGADIGRKIVNAESGANEISITVDDTGNVDDVWPFRTDNAGAIINLISDTGVTINFIGSQGEGGVKLEGYDQYVILRKTATNTYTASGNMVGYDATAVATASVDESLGDGEETTSSGSVANGSGALNFNDAQAVLTVFPGLSIPAGATIVSAVVTFEASATDSDAISQNINVESADAALSNTNNSSITNRTTTATTIAWSSIESWTDGSTYDTVDISSAVQEWVNRGGYDSSDNLGVIFTHLSGSGERVAISWNGTGVAPSISITYTN
ncbi:hypothetical protein AAY42_09985 [Flagellimonas eckloniae]|uniref:Uncharacterized protein n=1 Tax=Flagellimonas eckloniae TaxID=346185 RepID=A0A0Q1DME8_9FLAO|nr:hypothetical protein AAY42_09985 [Allomuricauda eckloniae]